MAVAKRALLLLVFAALVLGFATAQNCPTHENDGCPIGHYKSWDYMRRSDWGNMCPHFSTCKTGKHQSPINIPALPNNSTLPTTLKLDLNNLRVRLIRVGNYLSLPVNTYHTLSWGGKVWHLHRVEFHAPSEHTLNGEHAPLEVQLYFQYTDNSQTHTAAIAVLYDVRCCDDAFLGKVIPALPKRYSCECGNNRTEFWAPFNEACDQGPDNARLPDRCRPDCTLPYCGDAVQDSGEECDQGNEELIPNRCRPNCVLPTCGDNVTDPLYPYYEQCDDGNRVSGDGCSSTCQKECGNKRIDGDEVCDMGEHNSDLPSANPDTCRKNCLRKRCGDGIVDPGEQCDEGSYDEEGPGGSRSPNSCRPDCTLPRCGDGVVDNLRGEACEPNRDLYTVENDPCTTRCTLYCGDGFFEAARGEECDAGAQNSNSSSATCRPDCKLARCGDGIVSTGEECDDGEATARCSATCKFVCGNGAVDPGEQCDDGDPSLYPNNGNSNTRANACRLDCTRAKCGDGVVDFEEECDNGPRNNGTQPDTCRSDCKLPRCGDSIVDSNEDCDDGNTDNNDGCACCKSTCGDGIRQPNEECDDGSANSNSTRDRCRTNCVLHYCGDGVTDSTEECDFRSGKNPHCSVTCELPYCGNGVVERELGEECDEGPLNSYHSIHGCSPICTVNRCGQTLTEVDANLKELIRLPEVGAYCYTGSETHPPCTEGVQWFVLPDYRHMSPTQYYAFTNLISKNNRPLSSLNGRNPLMCSAPRSFTDPRAGAVCGNGIVEIGEQCDEGKHNNDVAANTCRTNCRSFRCGDGVKDGDEECDGESWCTAACKIDHRRYEHQSPKGCWNIPNQGIWNSCSRSNTCYGDQQSPIRLPPVCTSNRPYDLSHPTHIQYNPTPITIFNTGNDILLPVVSGGTFNYKGHTFVLSHIEFHEPSEHYIGDKRFPFEVQLFHTAQNPGEHKTVALAVLFEEVEQKNQFLQPILDRLPPFSDCSCGNGLTEPAMVAPGGRVMSEQCDLGARNSDSQPNGCRSNCRKHYCGDGVIDSGEVCDYGVLNSREPNQCRPNCIQPYCGDGVVDDELFEECDDGNNANNDGCTSDCRRECGDGFKSPKEDCDDGEMNSDTRSNACRSTCVKCYCGDNVVDGNEQCDDGRMNSDSTPNACRSNCRLPICGDGVVDDGEECDDSSNRCDPNCKLFCGNGVIDEGEQCDNGTHNSDLLPNACRTNCKFSHCGDSVRDSNEECDMGATNTYACQNCRIACGNGIIEAGEECDDGCRNNDEEPGSCRTNCRRAYCGDGVKDQGEECDNGNMNSNSTDACRLNCKLPRCGDRIVDSREQCDSGPGCDSSCHKLCGNGRKDPGELCDDGIRNSDSAIGCCRTNCLPARCGDGVTDANEECDDGPMNSNGPNSCRLDCTKPTCGDGIVDYLYGEVCDQGARNSFTAIDGCSPKCTLNLCSQSIHFDTTFNPADLLPNKPGAYHYTGSLNSPPCTEGTEWFVFSSPAPISSCQLDQFRNVLSGNTRCLQASNGREVEFLQENSVCGDGHVEGNEECDDGLQNSDYLPDSCRKNCRKARCGDGVKDKGEECDGTPNCNGRCVLDCNAGANDGNQNNSTAIYHGEDETTINVNFANILAK